MPQRSSVVHEHTPVGFAELAPCGIGSYGRADVGVEHGCGSAVVVAGSHPVEQRLETVEPLGVGAGAEVGGQSVEVPLPICCGSILGEREALERVTFGELVTGGVQADGQYPWLRVDIGVEVAEEQDRDGGAHARLERRGRLERAPCRCDDRAEPVALAQTVPRWETASILGAIDEVPGPATP